MHCQSGVVLILELTVCLFKATGTANLQKHIYTLIYAIFKPASCEAWPFMWEDWANNAFDMSFKSKGRERQLWPIHPCLCTASPPSLLPSAPPQLAFLLCLPTGCSTTRSLRALRSSTTPSLSCCSSAIPSTICWWPGPRWSATWSSSSTT